MDLREASALIIGTIVVIGALRAKNSAFSHIRTAIVIAGICVTVCAGLRLFDSIMGERSQINHRLVSTLSLFIAGVGLGAIVQMISSGQFSQFANEVPSSDKAQIDRAE